MEGRYGTKVLGGNVGIWEKKVVKSCEGYKKNSFLPKIKGLQKGASR